MANRDSKPGTEKWRADARTDFLSYQLLLLAQTVLRDYFDNEPEIGEYTTWLRRESRRTDGEVKLLEQGDDHPEHGRLLLTALRTINHFNLSITHRAFSAAVAVTYDPDHGDLKSGRIRQFQGDIAQAIESSRFWVDQLTELDLDLDEDDIDALEADSDADDDVAMEGDDNDDLAERRRELKTLARQISLEATGDDGLEVADEVRDWLEATPENLWPILDGAVAAAAAKRRDKKLIAAWLALLTVQLESIRYPADNGHPWALGMLDKYQHRLMDLAESSTLAHEDLFPLVAALGHAKVTVKPELSEALMESGPPLPDSMPPEEVLDKAVRPLIDELARTVTSPFEVTMAMSETAAVLPREIRCFIAHELALSPHPVMRETVPLMLLDADSEVRRAAALALDQCATSDTLSPVSLRRAIALRNWIPEADRAVLDQAIRKARSKGMQPAQWRSGPDPVLRASPVDGSGAQSVLFIGRSGRTALFAGLLPKQGFGIRDAWCHPDTPRREIASAVSEVQRKIPSPEVEREYIDAALQHALADGVAAGHPPDPALLEIAEAANGADWKDRRLDVDGAVQRLFAELPAGEQTAEAVAASLQRSLNWMRRFDLMDSWFEDDVEIHDAIDAMREEDDQTVAEALLGSVLNQRRGAWGERFVLLALWARAVKPGQPPPLGSGAGAITWKDLAVLAREVLSPRPLQEIPVMAEIAARSVAVVRDD